MKFNIKKIIKGPHFAKIARKTWDFQNADFSDVQ